MLTEALSMPARRSLAARRISKKRKPGPLKNQMIIKSRDEKRKIRTSPKRDVVRAALKATKDDRSKHQ